MNSTFSLAISYFHKQTGCLTRVKKITSHELVIFAINFFFFTCDMLLAFFHPCGLKFPHVKTKTQHTKLDENSQINIFSHLLNGTGKENNV